MSAITTISTERSLAAELLSSDELYFDLDARQESLTGCVLSWMPGLTKLPACCVVQRVSPQEIREPARWLVEVESAVRWAGSDLVRIYLQQPAPALERILRASGYRRRVEVAFLSPPSDPPGEEIVRFRELAGPRDWTLKERLHARLDSERGPDDYPNPAALWVEMVKRKCAAGQKRTFFLEVDGDICGLTGTIEMPNLLRLKNLVILPEFRRQGLGLQTVFSAWRLAAGEGMQLGLFGIDGEAGAAMYRRAGLTECGEQAEWIRSLEV
jgi:hypothetical protein